MLRSVRPAAANFCVSPEAPIQYNTNRTDVLKRISPLANCNVLNLLNKYKPNNPIAALKYVFPSTGPTGKTA